MTVLPNPQSHVQIAENKFTKDGNDTVTTTITLWCLKNWKALVSELLSTSVLVFLGCMSCIPLPGYAEQSSIYSAFGFGFAVLYNIQIFGHISGAHMNPTVTIASVIWGGTSVPLAVLYIVFQCAGSILGYWSLIAVSPIDLSQDGICVTSPREELTVWQSFGIEFALTATLIFLNCGVWHPANKKNQDSIAVKFGLSIAGLSLSGGPLTGASMNPARSLGPALLTGIWTIHWVYWVAPISGSIFAVLLYKFLWFVPETTKLSEDQNINIS